MSRPSRGYFDALMDGELERFLKQSREAGESFDQIAWDIRDRLGVDVSRETVRRWCHHYEIDAATAVEQAAS